MFMRDGMGFIIDSESMPVEGFPTMRSGNRFTTAPTQTSADAHKIHTADVSSFVDTSSAKLIEQINERSREFRYAPVVGVATLVASFLAGFAVSSLLLLLSVSEQIVSASALFAGVLVAAGGIYFTRRVIREIR
jgi:hypothetical protein